MADKCILTNIYALVSIDANAQPQVLFSSTFEATVEDERDAVIEKRKKAGENEVPLHILTIPVDETAAIDISDSYDHHHYEEKLKRDLASAVGRDVDDIPWDNEDLASLMDDCESEVYRNINKYGCDEDWSFDEVEKTFFPDIKALPIFMEASV